MIFFFPSYAINLKNMQEALKPYFKWLYFVPPLVNDIIDSCLFETASSHLPSIARVRQFIWRVCRKCCSHFLSSSVVRCDLILNIFQGVFFYRQWLVFFCWSYAAMSENVYFVGKLILWGKKDLIKSKIEIFEPN